MSRPHLSFLKASLFLTREEVKTLVILINIDIWDLLYCLGSLLPRKHLADKAPQRAVKRHVSTIAAQLTPPSLLDHWVLVLHRLVILLEARHWEWGWRCDYFVLFYKNGNKNVKFCEQESCHYIPMQRLVWHSGQWYLVFLLRILPLPSVVFQQKLQDRAGPSLAWEKSLVEEISKVITLGQWPNCSMAGAGGAGAVAKCLGLTIGAAWVEYRYSVHTHWASTCNGGWCPPEFWYTG